MVGALQDRLHHRGAPLQNAQIIVRPIFTWPDGRPGVWVMVNWPN